MINNNKDSNIMTIYAYQLKRNKLMGGKINQYKHHSLGCKNITNTVFLCD